MSCLKKEFILRGEDTIRKHVATRGQLSKMFSKSFTSRCQKYCRREGEGSTRISSNQIVSIVSFMTFGETSKSFGSAGWYVSFCLDCGILPS